MDGGGETLVGGEIAREHLMQKKTTRAHSSHFDCEANNNGRRLRIVAKILPAVQGRSATKGRRRKDASRGFFQSSRDSFVRARNHIALCIPFLPTAMQNLSLNVADTMTAHFQARRPDGLTNRAFGLESEPLQDAQAAPHFVLRAERPVD